MEIIFGIISVVLGVPLGLFFYGLINELFEIHYFGCGAVWSLFAGCIATGVGTVYLLINLIGILAFPLVIIFLVVWLFNQGKKNRQS